MSIFSDHRDPPEREATQIKCVATGRLSASAVVCGHMRVHELGPNVTELMEHCVSRGIRDLVVITCEFEDKNRNCAIKLTPMNARIMALKIVAAIEQAGLEELPDVPALSAKELEEAESSIAPQVPKGRMSVFALIGSHIEKHGYAPTEREICAALSISQGAVNRHIGRLCETGLLSRIPHRSRSITITPLGEAAMKEAS
ncbi:MAG TPA: winged helix-turn-helix transcriptional regulator [Phycisphaerae bacterium]|nr:winged helix-turn-helix transcriptional regulator [Phycisphaerae bacterium]